MTGDDSADFLTSGLTRDRRFDVPLLIGVIADTHLWCRSARQLPESVLSLFRRMELDLILHAGDANDLSVLSALGMIAPVIAVCGNNDDATLQDMLNEQERIEVEPGTIGLIHGHGGRSAFDRAGAAFPDEPDLVVFGHSHMPRIEQVGGSVLFNPGSPTDRRSSLHFGVGLIEVTQESISPRLVLFSSPGELDTIGKPEKPVRCHGQELT